MIEGHGGTDFENCRRMAWTEAKLFDALMDKLVNATSSYLIAQADAGAEALQIFDTWAGAVPAPLFERAVIAPTAKIVRAVKAKHPKLPVIGFPRASASHLVRYVAETGVDGIGIDQTTDLSWARDTLPANVALQGNLDPALLLAGGEAMAHQARAMLEAMRGRPYIFNLGHGVMQPTPPDHIARLVEIIRAA
jgi:uroporphyrinogen decarboxylase